MVAPRRFALLGHTHNLDDLVGDSDDIDEGTTNLFFTDERAQDAVGSILVDTTSIDFTYNDAMPSITAAVIPEFVQDTVGAMFTDSASIDFTYDDTAGTETAIVIDDSITNAKLANMVQATIKGRAAAAGTGDPTDLTAAQVATIVNSSLDHGALTGLSDDDHPQYPLAASTETISGAWDFTDTVDILADNKELRLGAGNDFRLYHDGSNNYIRSDTGSLFFHDANELFAVMFNSGGNSGSIGFYTDTTFRGQLSATGATNAIVTGAAVGDIVYRTQAGALIFSTDAGSTISFQVLASGGHVQLPKDNLELQIGAGQDLRLFHDGTNTKITNQTGQLNFSGAATFTFDRPVRLKGYTVATLPAGVVGDTAYVTDALAPAFLAVIVGGGAVVTPVFYNGANWVAD